jgi:glycosyltransferase involved in cell wall biosynthesis
MPPFDRSSRLPSTRAGPPADVVHLINPLWDPSGGSDWRTIEMFKQLREHRQVRLWSRFKPAAEFTKHYPIELVRPWIGQVPIGGTFIFVGAYFRIGHWYKAALPRRTILIYNTYQPDRLDKALRRLQAWHRTPVELVYTSTLLQKLSARPGLVIESPIDLARFTPARRREPGPFKVGRLSRDVVSKHHEEDPAIYAALCADGVDVRVVGGTCLRGIAAGLAPTVLLPAGVTPAVDFLHSLDCFYYRTSEHWLEAYGRVVFEAMACGLPVVCGRRGGYADYIVHGVNGFLFDTSAEALLLLRKLRDDPALRERVGRAARASVNRLYAGSSWRQKQAFFLQPPPAEYLPASAFDPTPSELR